MDAKVEGAVRHCALSHSTLVGNRLVNIDISSQDAAVEHVAKFAHSDDARASRVLAATVASQILAFALHR